MSKQIFVIEKWGPPKLREIFQEVQNEINERTPLASETIDLDEQPDGLRICVKEAPGSPGTGEGSVGGSGSPVDIYGALNGAPATYHLLQSSAPTPL